MKKPKPHKAAYYTVDLLKPTKTTNQTGLVSLREALKDVIGKPSK